MAVNGEASLISHTLVRKQVPMQKEEIIVMLPSALGKEAILHDTSVAIAAHLHCLISISIPTLLFAENALQNFLSSYITVTCTEPQKWFPCLKSYQIRYNSSPTY